MLGLVGKVYAQCESTGAEGLNLGDCLQLSNGVPVSSVYDTPAFLVNLIVRNVFVIGGIIIFLLIFYAGFKFIQDTTKGKEEAQKILTAAIVGAITMFSAYWILQIVQVLTGVNVGLGSP
jgi:ABC-type Na+ efflux pump permease subunit